MSSLLGKTETVQIPLDYYRILGLPVQATLEQVRQAHYDRTLQRPKWDYNDISLAARKALLDQAYSVLSNPVQRQTYDTEFLPQVLDSQPHTSDPAEADTVELDITEMLESSIAEVGFAGGMSTPMLDIADDYFVGALIIYLELSEYELILNLGESYGTPSGLQQLYLTHPHLVKTDIVLTVAIASLELAQEQWRQGHYETAAESLQMGLEFLDMHQTLADMAYKIEAELYRLRPYRILELLAIPENWHPARQRGLQLLREMLQERQGIDGGGNDRSGLNTADFLRFVQQLRSYLTTEEQLEIFVDASPQSAVASYLLLYAIIGQGFAKCQPEDIRQASQILHVLSHRQDVHIEQAICCLLLGQTNLAYRLLENAPDPTALEFIQDQTGGSEDFLPGLCRYVEHWLKQEVLPYCRGLTKLDARLNPYFEDPEVQNYLERYLADAERQPNSQLTPSVSSFHQPMNMPRTPEQWTVSASPSSWQNPAWATTPDTEADPLFSPQPQTPLVTGSIARDQHPFIHKAVQGQAGGSTTSRSTGVATLSRPVSRDRSEVTRGGYVTTRPYSEDSAGLAPQSSPPHRAGGDIPNTQGRSASAIRAARRKRKRSSNVPASRPWWLLLALGVGVGVVALAWHNLLKSSSPELVSAVDANQLAIRLDEPLLPPETLTVAPTPAASPSATSAGAPLTVAIAETTVSTWLQAKQEAMGQSHNLKPLEQVLTGNMLTQWQQMAQQAQQQGWYVTYDHQITPGSVKVEALNNQRSRVYAAIRETSKEFSNGSNQPQSTSQDALVVRYELVLIQGQWRIQTAEVVKQG